MPRAARTCRTKSSGATTTGTNGVLAIVSPDETTTVFGAL